MGVRLLRQYTTSGRALTAALGRVGHRARRNSCLGAREVGLAVVEVAVVAHFVPWLECPHFATAGSHDRDGASWRRRASWSEPSPGRHRIRADTDTRRGRADPSLPAVATERLTSSFGHPHGSASGRRAAARASPTAPLRVQRQWSVGARTSNRSTPIGLRRVPGDERVLPALGAARRVRRNTERAHRTVWMRREEERRIPDQGTSGRTPRLGGTRLVWVPMARAISDPWCS